MFDLWRGVCGLLLLEWLLIGEYADLDTGWIKCFGTRKMAKFHWGMVLYDIWRKYAMAVQIWRRF